MSNFLMSTRSVQPGIAATAANPVTAGPAPTSDFPGTAESGQDVYWGLTPPTGLAVLSGTYTLVNSSGFDVTQGGHPLLIGTQSLTRIVDIGTYTLEVAGVYNNVQSFAYTKIFEVVAPVDYSDPANADQSGIPVEERQYPIVGILGAFGDDTQTFEEQTPERKVAYAAQRWHNEQGTGLGNVLLEQRADYFILEEELRTSGDSITANSANYNQRWIDYYAFGAGAGPWEASWEAYNNWLLGVNDGLSYWPAWGGGWNGTLTGFRSYAGWYIEYRRNFDSAVPHNVVP